MKEILNKIGNRKVFFITIFLWLFWLLTGIQGSFFLKERVLRSIFFRALHFFFLYFIVFIVYQVFLNRKEEKYKHGILFFSIAFLLYTLFLLCAWPGAWYWDDIGILSAAQNYGIDAWQHPFSSIFYILCLETIPFGSGVLLMQIFFASTIIGYVVSHVSLVIHQKNHLLTEIFLFLPFAFPPILLFILSGFRITLYSFIELFLIVYLFLLYEKKNSISSFEVVALSILTIIVSTWRTEGIYYTVFLFLELLLFYQKKIPKKKILISFLVTLFSTLGIMFVTNKILKNNDYSITAIIEPLQALIKASDEEKDKQELEKINKVIDVSFIKENPTWKGPDYFWNGALKQGYTKEEYADLMSSYISLILKYPNVFLKDTSQVFWDSSGMSIHEGQTYQVRPTESLLLEDETLKYGKYWNSIQQPFSKIWNSKLRNNTMLFLLCMDETHHVTIPYYFFWNLWIPILVSILLCIIQIWRKKFFLASLFCFSFIRIFLVFFTSSTPYFMYYMSVYLIMYFLIIINVLKIIFDSKKNMQKQNKCAKVNNKL